MSDSERNLDALDRLFRLIRNPELEPPERISQLYEALFHKNREDRSFALTQSRRARDESFELSDLENWDPFSLERALSYAENVIAIYAREYFDPRVLPVTYYQRERRVRRHLDQQFSHLFKELIRRNGHLPEKELLIEEPIYFLKQQARDKRFPRGRDRKPCLDILVSRLHLALSHRLAS